MKTMKKFKIGSMAILKGYGPGGSDVKVRIREYLDEADAYLVDLKPNEKYLVAVDHSELIPIK